VSFPSNCTVAGQTLTCTLDPADLQVADPAIVITLTVALAADAPSGTYTNKASVTTADDPACVGEACVPPCPTAEGGSAANNTDCEDTPGIREATISVTKTDSVDSSVRVGDVYSYTIVVTNNGPSTVSNVTLADDLPAGLNFVSAGGSGWTCNNIAALRCDWSGTLAVGASTSALRVNVSVSGFQSGTQIVNFASAAALVDDKGTPDPADDVVARADDSETTPVAATVAVEPPSTVVPPEVVQLPRTGSDVERLMSLAAILFAAGLGLVQIVRRRRPI
jgi:uncharacterized repeat protein (TIGR01451 family)/LPXTG-motif cell wall-anchored protein